MPGKTESKEDAVAVVGTGGGVKAWLPVIIVIVLTPAICWAVVEYMLLPRLQARLDGVAVQAAVSPTPSGDKGHETGAVDNYEFNNVVVNLAGTMGTRYLKVSFVVSGAEPGIKSTFESRKAQLTDVTLNVLSSLTLAELEEPGAKNVLRERLVATYNQTVGRRVADQVYFSDFVIQ
jgi:flagellar FliL protein